ncbi:hypothetical protein AMK06_CH02301 [Rhizobium sp. N541]|nr:hypothetical protein AMK06_CH02301 [Rhizobium sp. N541]ANM23580.1 hypothetical protein AMK07_CH02298 [Rhizobium sp. N941]
MLSALNDIIILLEHLDQVPEPWARNVAIRLNRFVSGQIRDVTAALDLKVPRGRRAWQTLSLVDARDAAIPEAAAKFFPAQKPK